MPDGSYSLTIFDTNLDVVIAQQAVTVSGGTCNNGPCDLGEVAVFNWFTRLNTAIFSDLDQDGFWDANEPPAGSERGPVQIRWRDGTIYQAFGTDTEGFAPFDEIFPFFHWQVAEVGFSRDKITGATFVTDAGGFVDTSTDAFPGFGELTPQPQVCTESQSNDSEDPHYGCVVGTALDNPNTGDNLSRTDLGTVLTQAFQGFLGQTSVMQFGTAPYVQFTDPLFDPINGFTPPQFVGENGGISGLVVYATTRAEDDPELAVAEEWEPGVPRAQISLYADGDIDTLDPPTFPPTLFPNGIADIDWNGDGITETADPLDPRRSLLTNTTENLANYIGLFSNITGDPAFVKPYLNGSRDSLFVTEPTILQTAGAFDEGGNFIQVIFGPLSLVDYSQPGADLDKLFDYHIGPGSTAIDGASHVSSNLTRLLEDIDNDPRPLGVAADIGADELQ